MINTHDAIIAAWLRTTLGETSPELSELHIDRIDPSWRDRNKWIEGGVRALAGAKTLLKESSKATVALAFSLGDSPNLILPTIASEQWIQRELDHSPPALRLFREGHEPWQPDMVARWEVDVEPLGKMFPGTSDSFLLQFRTPSMEGYARTLCVV